MSYQEDISGECAGVCPPPAQLKLYQTIIFATPILFSFMLLLMFCMLYFRRRARRIDSHMRTHLFIEGLLATAPLDQGLSKSFRRRLPIALFDDEFASTCQDSQCAVCLADYQANEKLQVLPLCNHSFHVQCIDKWLSTNVTCPICRTSLNEVIHDNNVDHVQVQSSDALSVDLPSREGDEYRAIWEDRVVNEIQDQSLLAKCDASNGESSHDVALCERLASEHTINIERS